MICYKCGSELPDGVKFCRKCGAKLVDDDIEQQVVTSTPAGPVQQAQPSQQQVVPMNMPKKVKSVKLPILIGVFILAVAIVAIAVNIEKNQQRQSSANSEDVNLSETYTNDIAGISFDYPDGWVILDSPSEFEIVKMIDSKNNADSIAQFEVTYILDIDPLGVFTGNEASVRENVSEFASFLGFWDTTIDDIPVKSVMYQIQGLAGDSIVKRYYYIIEDDAYQITCSYSISTANMYEPIFDAIIDSYTIKAPIVSSNIDAQSISDESIIYSLDYRGYALAELLGSRREELDDIYGTPTGGTLVDGYLMYGGTEYHEYNGGEMYAIMNEETGTVAEISVMANATKLNGDAMDLTREEIKKLFGEPSYEDVDYDEYGEEYGYIVEYIPVDGGFYLSFWLPDINTEAYDITIGRYSEY